MLIYDVLLIDIFSLFIKDIKNIFLFAFLLLFIGITFTGCVDRCEKEVFRYYITEYSVSHEITLFSDYSNQDNLYEIRFLWNNNGIVSHTSKGKDLDAFKELAQKNGDISYNEVIECSNLGPLPVRCYFSEPISQISITCDKDIDPQHPAGTPLNDLFLFLTFSPDKFLKNGYKPLNIDTEKELAKVDNRFYTTVKNNVFKDFGTSSEMVYGTLSEIDFSRYKFLGIPGWGNRSCAEFSWIIPPVNVSNYTLTVEIEFVGGLKKMASLTVGNEN